MNIDSIFKLIDAGFTADDIKKMYDEPKGEPKDKPKDKPKGEPKDKPKDEPKDKPKDEPPKPESLDLESYVKDLNDRVGKLVDTVGAMQADNISKADAGEPAPKPTFEELVANFTKDM